MDIDFLCTCVCVCVYRVLLKPIYYSEFEGMVAAVICVAWDFAPTHLHNTAECRGGVGACVCVCGGAVETWGGFILINISALLR